MVFSSSFFLFFFLPVVLAAYFLLRAKYRNAWIFAVSTVFYFWGENELTWVLLISVLVNYLLARAIQKAKEKTPQSKTPLILLIGALFFNLGLLAYFKYANFFVLDILQAEPGNWQHIALPIGISFFTFQCLSYVIDVYRGTVPATRKFIDFGCYVTCFPQLIAGPIVRYSDIYEQLKKRSIRFSGFCEGIERFIIGLAKKVLIANTLSEIADGVFSSPATALDAPQAWLGIVCYTFQIYFDFSGYSDMAIGLGKMFGFTFPENFRHPYIAQSMKDFWHRWHISLSTWLRDYLYIPLGGSRVGGSTRRYVNLLIVFTLCGLWHGASWSFIFWGFYHGAFLVLENTPFGKILSRLPALLRHAYLLLIVMIGWVFFRTNTIGEGWDVLKAAAGLNPSPQNIYSLGRYLSAHSLFILIAATICATPLYEFIRSRCPENLRLAGKTLWYTILLGLFILCLMSISASTYNPFLYFRF